MRGKRWRRLRRKRRRRLRRKKGRRLREREGPVGRRRKVIDEKKISKLFSAFEIFGAHDQSSEFCVRVRTCDMTKTIKIMI